MNLLFIAILLLCFGCSQKPPKQEIPPVSVEVGEVTQKDVPLTIETFGNVYETSLVQIRPQVQGILLKAYVEQGQFVEKGDLLYEIDARPYQAVLDQAKATLLRDEANLELAKITVKRNEDLVKQDFISKLAFEQYQTNVKAAEAQVEADKATVESAKINLDYTKISAPISGKVSLYNVYPGNLVVVNDPNALIEIRQITPVDIRFTLSQRDFQELQKYQALKDLNFDVYLPNDESRIFKGKIYFFDNHLDPLTGTILFKGHIANEDHVLWPGEYVRVRLIIKILENALLIPYAALQQGQQGSYVYLVQPDMTVKVTKVEIGQKTDSTVVVTSGLKLGDRVVTNGQVNLRGGAKVAIIGSNP